MLNFNVSIVTDYLNYLSIENFEEKFRNYLIEITYMENENLNNNPDHSNKGENGKNNILIDESNKYKEIFY